MPRGTHAPIKILKYKNYTSCNGRDPNPGRLLPAITMTTIDHWVEVRICFKFCYIILLRLRLKKIILLTKNPI